MFLLYARWGSNCISASYNSVLLYGWTCQNRGGTRPVNGWKKIEEEEAASPSTVPLTCVYHTYVCV